MYDVHYYSMINSIEWSPCEATIIGQEISIYVVYNFITKTYINCGYTKETETWRPQI
jgi:hypothetical protein